MRVKVTYRADSRLNIVELRSGSSAFLADLINFLDMSKVDISETTSGESTLTPQQYSQLKREGATPNAPRRSTNLKRKSYDFD